MQITTSNTVRELAVAVPGATRIFEQVGIDYCCGGGETLAEACKKSAASAATVIQMLEATEQSINPGDKVRDWQAESLTSLAAYIIDTHHFFTKQQLIRLGNLLDKVCSRHGENHPEISELRTLFGRLKQDLVPHMLKEEQVLFPFIAQMEEAISEQRAISPPFFVSVQNPVSMMMTEHDAAGELLDQMRKITGDYDLPSDACISYRRLYQALQEFEADLHQHIHLENNILFPRAVEMESAVEPSWGNTAREFGEHRCFGH
jgi:regulator of cell morphogenesis and NO signaling